MLCYLMFNVLLQSSSEPSGIRKGFPSFVMSLTIRAIIGVPPISNLMLSHYSSVRPPMLGSRRNRCIHDAIACRGRTAETMNVSIHGTRFGCHLHVVTIRVELPNPFLCSADRKFCFSNKLFDFLTFCIFHICPSVDVPNFDHVVDAPGNNIVVGIFFVQLDVKGFHATRLIAFQILFGSFSIWHCIWGNSRLFCL